MKTHLQILILVLSFLIPSALAAQDKIYSLALKQHEIEEAIRKSLSPFLGKKDYVIKVRLKGERKVEDLKTFAGEFKTKVGETLPGFELEDRSALPKITDMVGESYWIIKSMRIDLIMHKEISPSIDTFVRETIPVVSEMDPARGDRFKFVPILPKAIGDEVETDLLREGPVAKKYYGLTRQEWLYIGAGTLVSLIIIILLWKLTSLRRNLRALEEAFEHEQRIESTEKEEDPLLSLQKERSERLAKQEELVNEAVLRDENEHISQEIITQLLGRKDWVSQLYEAFGQDKQGVEKLSQLIAVLGPHTSRKLFCEIMGDGKYLEIEKMAESVNLQPGQEKALLVEIQKIIFTQKLVSPEKVSMDPFSFLHELSNGQIEFLIKDEPVKIKSITLSQLSSEDNARILSRLPKDERNKVILQLGNINDLPLALIEKVAFNLADKAKSVPDDNSVGFDGVDMVVNVISESNKQARQEIINNLRVSDRKLSEKVESRLFLFDSIPLVPADILTEVVRKMPSEEVITAIVGSAKKLQEKVIMCFPEKIRRTLVGSLKAKKVTEKEIKEKQKMIIKAMQKMADEKRIDLRKIQAAWEKTSPQNNSVKSA